MTRKEWDALKASGKVVELIPKDLAKYFVRDYSHFQVSNIAVERERNCARAKALRDRYREIIFEDHGIRVAK